MTREEAKQGFEDMKKGIYPFYPNEYFDMAIKALAQEPIIDKIRAEIEELRYGQPFRKFVVDECLEIIDKYSADRSENGKWANNDFGYTWSELE